MQNAAANAWKTIRNQGGAAGFDDHMRLGFALDTLVAAMDAEI